MTYLTNYWPDPRFYHTESLKLNGCVVSSVAHDFMPSAGKNPGMVLRASQDGNNWAERTIPVPAGAKLVAIIGGSIPSGAEPQVGKILLQIWSTDGEYITDCNEGDKASDEFTVPSNGQIKVTFRAPKTNGRGLSLWNMFIGKKADLDALNKINYHFLAGDLMPLNS